MNPFQFVFLTLLFSTFAVLSIPIHHHPNYSHEVVADGIIGFLVLGTAFGIASYLWQLGKLFVKGAVDSHVYRSAIDHWFEELKRWEAEKKAVEPMIRNGTDISENAGVESI
jgi:hypothetical protein